MSVIKQNYIFDLGNYVHHDISSCMAKMLSCSGGHLPKLYMGVKRMYWTPYACQRVIWTK